MMAWAGPAYADAYLSTNSYGGNATWTENGDTLTVCDTKADGYGVRGYIYEPYLDDFENGTVLIKGNDPSSDGNCASFAENISETIRIGMKVCQYKGDWVGYCHYAVLER